MSTGFIIALAITFVIIIGSTIWVTNKAYSRKPDPIDPMPQQEWMQKELDQ
ncbi:hypothetical protein ACFSO0_13495 [Brevibacillus sp. GCM10020057]|uniref:hypothetical protein n=1 Tax=Brevibacillus sp. GCM10020057 TaxID=3317327 RepID=UPI00362C0242